MDVVHGAAHRFAVPVLGAEVNGQDNFGKLRRHAEKGTNAHPENRPRPTADDGGGYADDIASAQGARQSCGCSLKGGDAPFSAAFANVFEGILEGAEKVPKLHKPQPEGEKNPRPHQDD